MINFFLKKNFYDGWDNVIVFFIPNLIFNAVLLLGGTLFFIGTKMSNGLIGMIFWFVSALFVFILGSILVLTWGYSAFQIADYGIPGIKEFFKNIKSCIVDGILYGITVFFCILISIVGALYFFKPVVNAIKTAQPIQFAGLLAGCIFIWICVTIFAGLFWFPAMRAILKNNFLKTLKKCFIVLLDNIGKSIFLGFYNFLLLFASLILLGLAPGLAGIGLARVNFLRILLKKYDYLEELEKDKEKAAKNPLRKIPWNEILADEIETTGSRTAKSFFFPWKE